MSKVVHITNKVVNDEEICLEGIFEKFKKFQGPQHLIRELIINGLVVGGYEGTDSFGKFVNGDIEVSYKDLIFVYLNDLLDGLDDRYDEDLVNDLVEFIMENEYDWDLEVNE